MPCRSDYLEPTAQDIESKLVADHLQRARWRTARPLVAESSLTESDIS